MMYIVILIVLFVIFIGFSLSLKQYKRLKDRKEQLAVARQDYVNRMNQNTSTQIIVTTSNSNGIERRTVVVSRPPVVKPSYYEEPPPPYPGLEATATGNSTNYGYTGSSSAAITSVPVPNSTSRPPAYAELDVQQLPGSIGPSTAFPPSTVTPLAITQAHVLPQKK